LAQDAIRRAFDRSLSKLKFDYIDLYMVHWPSHDMDLPAVMRSLAALQAEGRTRAIGVCNVNMAQGRHAIDDLYAPIAALQIEYPFLDQSRMLNYLRLKGIMLVAFGPLPQGRATDDWVLNS
jgi:2,5-diketo-D-gluconate reductase B